MTTTTTRRGRGPRWSSPPPLFAAVFPSRPEDDGLAISAATSAPSAAENEEEDDVEDANDDEPKPAKSTAPTLNDIVALALQHGREEAADKRRRKDKRKQGKEAELGPQVKNVGSPQHTLRRAFIDRARFVQGFCLNSPPIAGNLERAWRHRQWRFALLWQR